MTLTFDTMTLKVCSVSDVVNSVAILSLNKIGGEFCTAYFELPGACTFSNSGGDKT